MVTENIQELVDLGKQHFDNKDYLKAERYLREVLRFNKRYADVHNMLGVINHIEGRFSNAVDYFKEAIKINPNYTEALLNLAVLYNDLGQYQEAKQLYTHLRKQPAKKNLEKDIEPVLKGRLSNMHADIGDVYRSIGLYSYAIEEYQKALLLNPQYVDIRTNLGVALREGGKLDDSIKELKTVLKQDPKFSNARIQLGVTFYSQGATQEAQKEWDVVLKQDKDNESAKMYLRLNASTPKKSGKH